MTDGLDEQGPDSAALRMAYSEVCSTYRAIDDFRGKLLALLPIASGAGGILLLQNANLDPTYLWQIGVFGLTISVGLFIYEVCGIRYCRRLIEVGKLIECEFKLAVELKREVDGKTLQSKLGPFVEIPRPILGIVRVSVASYIVYGSVMLGWAFIIGVGLMQVPNQ